MAVSIATRITAFTWQRGALLWLTLLLAGCSTLRPWINQPASTAVLETSIQASQLPGSGTIVGAVTFSGGGARAAAFGLGVLRELKATPLLLGDSSGSMLDSVVLVSGVSGGSVLATYYAAFGDEVFTRFEPEFLHAGFQGRLLNQVFTPASLWDLSSPWYGRGNILADQLDQLFRGQRFSDLRKRPGAPLLVVGATDLTTGVPFEFTAEQLALMCTDLAEIPLSFATAASASVPLLLSPLTLRNYADRCQPPVAAALGNDAEENFRTHLFRLSTESFLDAQARPYIHLVDGGVSDNLGVRPLLDRLLVDGSLSRAFHDAPRGSIRRIVLYVVNAERGLGERIDQSDTVPTLFPVLETLVFGAGSRETQITLALLRDDLQRWTEELALLRGQASSPFASDAQIHVIGVSLADTGDPSLAQIPTAFTILPDDVRRLRDAGQRALRESPQFQAMLRGLHESIASPTRGP